jgi:hypothetical protein
MPILVQSTRASAQLSGTEKALKHTYDDLTEKWDVKTIYVRLDPTVIAEGTNRLVYNIIDLSAPKGKQNKVAKAAKSRNETRQETFKAVVMQKRCQRLAEKFNSLGAPKKVNFIDACIVEFVQRPADFTGGHPIMIMEPRLEGPYKKHSNNFGYVDKEDRNTPQAFSHFTFQYTNSKIIVVDIQGVKDNYTDPQIHSNIPESAPPIWGQGDMGDTGVHKFFESHRCNALCKFFGLNPNPMGTMRSSTRMGAAAQLSMGAMPLLTASSSGMHLSPSMGYTSAVPLPLPSAAYSNVAYTGSSQLSDYLDTRSAANLFTYSNPVSYSWGSELIVC